LEPRRDFIAFSAFVSFFPQLVAGPIERASNLLPQFQYPRSFNYSLAVDGLRQILWGLFKKVVIADNCAIIANYMFAHSAEMEGSGLLLGAIFFAFQIYGDFSGYSDIAIGVARLFGFQLMRNFAFPYFSRDIAEFWRRWHISLSTWFRDYLYIPLGGSRGGTGMKVRNTFIIFVVSGFWHGANWTFIIWGLLNALYFLPLLLSENNRRHIEIVARDRKWPTIRESALMLNTFILTVLAWIFFRADSLSHALEYLSGIFSRSFFRWPDFELIESMATSSLLLVFFLIVEWFGRKGQYGLDRIGSSWPRAYRWGFYVFVIFLIGMYLPSKTTPFIYFQF
jgi:D-alanyl-lipoteichoic acid acyltransferase DltB (MBOAT superfamily)